MFSLLDLPGELFFYLILAQLDARSLLCFMESCVTAKCRVDEYLRRGSVYPTSLSCRACKRHRNRSGSFVVIPRGAIVPARTHKGTVISPSSDPLLICRDCLQNVLHFEFHPSNLFHETQPYYASISVLGYNENPSVYLNNVLMPSATLRGSRTMMMIEQKHWHLRHLYFCVRCTQICGVPQAAQLNVPLIEGMSAQETWMEMSRGKCVKCMHPCSTCGFDTDPWDQEPSEFCAATNVSGNFPVSDNDMQCTSCFEGVKLLRQQRAEALKATEKKFCTPALGHRTLLGETKPKKRAAKKPSKVDKLRKKLQGH